MRWLGSTNARAIHRAQSVFEDCAAALSFRCSQISASCRSAALSVSGVNLALLPGDNDFSAPVLIQITSIWPSNGRRPTELSLVHSSTPRRLGAKPDAYSLSSMPSYDKPPAWLKPGECSTTTTS